MPTISYSVHCEQFNRTPSSFTGTNVNRQWCVVWNTATGSASGTIYQGVTPPSNPYNVTITNPTASGCDVSYDLPATDDLSIIYAWNAGPPPGSPSTRMQNDVTVIGLRPPVVISKYATSDATVATKARVEPPADYLVNIGDRTAGGTHSAFFQVSPQSALIIRGGVTSASDGFSTGFDTPPTHTNLEISYAHPALVSGTGLTVIGAVIAPYFPGVPGGTFFGFSFEVKYDANVTEFATTATPMPRFRSYDSLGRVSAWAESTTGTGGVFGYFPKGFEGISAIRIRDLKDTVIFGGSGTLGDPYEVNLIDIDVDLAPSFNPYDALGSVGYASIRNGSSLGGITRPDVFTDAPIAYSDDGAYQIIGTVNQAQPTLNTMQTVSVYFNINNAKNPAFVHPNGFTYSATQNGANTEIARRTKLSDREVIANIANTSPISLKRQEHDGAILFGARDSTGVSRFYKSTTDAGTISGGPAPFTAMAAAFPNTHKIHDMEPLFGGTAGAVGEISNSIRFKFSPDGGTTWQTEVVVGPKIPGMRNLNLTKEYINGKDTLKISDSLVFEYISEEGGAENSWVQVI